MRNLLTNFLFKRGSNVELIVVAVGLAIFVLACGGSSKPAKPVPSAYLGEWKAADGGTLTIAGDGTGKYISGSGNAKFEGVAVNVDEADKTIKMTLAGFEVKKFSIDQPASGGQMKLDGIVYKNSSGSTSTETKSSDDKKSSDTKGSPFGDSNSKSEDKDTKTSSSGEVPSNSEVDELSGETMHDFHDAVQKGNFDDFYSTLSDGWKEQISANKLDEPFADFIKKKVDLSPKSGAKPTYSPAPFINSDGLLEVDGSYESKSGNVMFKLKYMKEGGKWKLFGIRVNV